jgi:hypothetical protein
MRELETDNNYCSGFNLVLKINLPFSFFPSKPESGLTGCLTGSDAG